MLSSFDDSLAFFASNEKECGALIKLLEILPSNQQAVIWLLYRATQLTVLQIQTMDLVQALNRSELSQALYPTSAKPLDALTRATIASLTYLRQPQAACLERRGVHLTLTDIGRQVAVQIQPKATWERVARQISEYAADRQKSTAPSQ